MEAGTQVSTKPRTRQAGQGLTSKWHELGRWPRWYARGWGTEPRIRVSCLNFIRWALGRYLKNLRKVIQMDLTTSYFTSRGGTIYLRNILQIDIIKAPERFSIIE